jgi:transcriptional regulator with XRE-family HTH domain
MSLREKFAHLISAAQTSVAYWRDVATSDFTRDLHARMERMGITHTELAARMGTSRPYVTKLLSGGNFTLETMVKLAMALDGVVRIQIEDRDAGQPIARMPAEIQNRADAADAAEAPVAAAPPSQPPRKRVRRSIRRPVDSMSP